MKELDGENYKKKKTWLGSHGANILKTVNWKKLILQKNLYRQRLWYTDISFSLINFSYRYNIFRLNKI